MEIEVFERVLSQHLNNYMEDMLKLFKRLLDGKYELDENLNRIISDHQGLSEIPREVSTEIINTLEAILKLNEVSEKMGNLIVQRLDEDTLINVRRELGAYDKTDYVVIDQVRLFYQSRIIFMLISKFSKYFNRSQYDIFLSHSSIDAREIMGLKLLLLYEHGLTSYVDWLDDFQLNYLRATQKIIYLYLEQLNNAESTLLIRLEKMFETDNFIKKYSSEEITEEILQALEKSNNFFYVDSKNSRFSKWMPFELGYAEAQVNKPIFRIVIQYKRTRKGSIKYSSFLYNLELIDDIDKVIPHLNLRVLATI